MKSLVAYDWPEGRCKQVAYISPDHHVREFYIGLGGRSEQADLTFLTNAPLAESRFLAAYAWSEGPTKQVAYVGQDKHIQELWVPVDGQWQRADLQELAGAPPVWQITAGYSWSAGHSKQVVYIGDDGHIHELWVEKGAWWQHIDLTAVTNAPLPGSHYMVGYGWDEGRCKQVAYVGQDGQIHELFMPQGQSWQHVNLSALTQAPRAVDLMVGFEWPEGRCKQIAFVSEDRHVHELSLVAGESWRHTDLSATTSAPPATDVLTGYVWPQGRSKQIAYVGLDRHVHELSVTIGGDWHYEDLTAKANAPVTAITAMDGCAWSTGETKQVIYVGNDGQVRELLLPYGGQWMYTDLSSMISALPARF